MSKLHQPHGRADADTTKGELRKADDYSDQPGQGETGPGETDRTVTRAEAVPAEGGVGTSEREYGHSSGDRNTRREEQDWPGFEGGIQRDAPPEPRPEPDRPAPRRR